ncbi:hypothetical protein DV736_g4449, partial [Chaetothyriales sp. CBS 134916]
MDIPRTLESGGEHFDRIQAHLLSLLAPSVPLVNPVDAPPAHPYKQHRTKELLNRLDRILSVLQTDHGVDATQATEEARIEDHTKEELVWVGSVFDHATGR